MSTRNGILLALGLCAASLACCGGAATVRMLPGENWWGCANYFGPQMPFGERTSVEIDLRENGWYNQYASLLVSDRGRVVWCDRQCRFVIRDGAITVEPEGDAEVEVHATEGGLRDAFLYASARHFPPSGKTPHPKFFESPQYNTWIELTYNQNEKDILAYAQSMLDNGLPPGVLMIDDTWQTGYGEWDFDGRRFKDPKGMVARLHEMGFKVILWICPWVGMDTPAYRRLARGRDPGTVVRQPIGGLYTDGQGKPAACDWWNGVSALLDFTHPQGRGWFKATLDRLVADYGVDGFKLDGGALPHYKKGFRPHENLPSGDQANMFAAFALQYPVCEYRHAWKLGGQPIVERLHDKKHSWEDLRTLVPSMMAGGLLGHPFMCPDMIGGGEWTCFLPGAAFDPELFVRSAQVHALCGQMQFSASPWRVLKDPRHRDIVREAVSLRQKFADRFVKLAEECGRTGEPMIRNLEYAFPHRGYAGIIDQFMMGDFLMVAPVMEKGAVSRKVVIPPGKWVADDGQTVEGPAEIEVKAPLSRLPHFLRVAPTCASAGAFSLTNENVVLSMDARGWTTRLVERATGRVLADGSAPFVRVKAGSRWLNPSSAEPRGADAWAWKFGKTPGEVVVGVKPFAGGWTFDVRAVTVPGADELRLCGLGGIKCRKYAGAISQTVSDDDSGIAVRGYDLYASTAVGAEMSALLRAADAPFAGRRVGFAAGRKTDLVRALQAMTVEAGVPHSTAGGAWALSSEQCRGSYLNVNVTADNVDYVISLALRGGFDVVHFREHWYACRGHYPVNTKDWPGGLPQMKAAVEKIHAAGLRAGLHTLSGCIDPKDAWITPRCSSDLMAWATYTLAAPLGPEAKELVVEEMPIDGHDVTFTYHGNGNAIRIGEEIVQYTGVRREKPYAFTGLTRGAFGTVVSDHAAGEKADYLQQRYIAFYPKPDSALAVDLAKAIGHVYRTCGFDQIYCDGIEGMYTKYGMAKMRHLIMAECTADGRPCLNEDSASGSLPACWWFHSRVGAWDSTYWAPKRFHDFHVSSIRSQNVRERDMREIQMGWWSIKRWTPQARSHCADEIEYYSGKNAALDASMSTYANLDYGPLGFGIMRQWTILGWYENFRRAGAFADGVAEKLGKPRAEFRLRQDGDGVWRFAPAVCRSHRVHSAVAAQWKCAVEGAPRDSYLRLEALYAGAPFDAPSAISVLAPGDVPSLHVTNAPAVRCEVSAAEDPVRGRVTRFRATNGGAVANGAWACAAHEFRPYKNVKGNSVVAFWVKGDGSGALLNVQVMTPREYGLCYSEHYVRLDFSGWRYMEMPFSETSAEEFSDHEWPYADGDYAQVFHRVINTRNVSAVKLYFDEVPPGGAAEAVLSDVRLVPMRDSGCLGPTVVVNGKSFMVPFDLKSGEFAEYGDGFWTHLDKYRTPIKRVAAAGALPLVPGENTLAYHAKAMTDGAWPRAEVTLFAFGDKFPALRDLADLKPERRRIVGYEAVAPCRYDPEHGFGEIPPLVARPGERAEPEFEVVGPIGAFEVSIGGVTRKFAAVAEGKVFRCDAGTFPPFAGTAQVVIRADDPASARATFSFAKRYCAVSVGE